MRCSTRQLIAAAAPATRAIPSVAAKTRPGGGTPGVARNIPMIATKTISETTRGFVSARNWRKRLRLIVAVVMEYGRNEPFYATAATGAPSSDPRSAKQPRQVARQRLDVRRARPRQHLVANRIDQVDRLLAQRQRGDVARRRAHDDEIGMLGEHRRIGSRPVRHEPQPLDSLALATLHRPRLPRGVEH